LILCAIVVLNVVFSGGKRKSVDKESSATTAEGGSITVFNNFFMITSFVIAIIHVLYVKKCVRPYQPTNFRSFHNITYCMI
jgi:hypothetical protein